LACFGLAGFRLRGRDGDDVLVFAERPEEQDGAEDGQNDEYA
jgi:hypothetical protein